MYFTKERNARLAEKLFRHIRDTTTDLLPGTCDYDLSIYVDPEVARQERERIFQRAPMMAAHSAQLAEPDAYLALKLNTSEVLLTRRADGTVAAFLNLCRHRGAKLVLDEAGRRSRFTCRYHGWTYGNDGRLRGIGFGDTFGASPADIGGCFWRSARLR